MVNRPAGIVEEYEERQRFWHAESGRQPRRTELYLQILKGRNLGRRNSVR
jgi:hypothetical protein